jgi:nicotinamide phosphoribosyltransferase
MDMNPILTTDSYKFSHWKQYPPGTEYVRSYFESRGGEYDKVLSFGALQYYVHEVLMKPITQHDIAEADEFVTAHLGPGIFNRDGWGHILRVHGGYLPLNVRAVPEGYFIPTGNVLLTVENTDPKVPWLTNYLETRLSNIWYPYTVATLSNHCRQLILSALRQTGDPGLIDFKLQDFGYRGVSSQESAAIGGLAHLVNFKGSDTVAAIVAAQRYYGCPMAGFSIPAAEHSTITSWGRDHEVDAYRNMLTSYPTGLVAVVSDSFNIYDACSHLWGETLHDEVLKRDGVLVVRPDSGHPPTVVKKVLEILGQRFGYSVNQKGFKVLNPKVRVIQGDGCDPVMIDMVLGVMAINGWSADNIAFGMGGGLLQKVNRDTLKFAFKCSSIVVNGFERGVSKSPVDDPGKNSKAGNLTLYVKDNGEYVTADRNRPAPGRTDFMQTIYVDGLPRHKETLDEIRNRHRIEELRYFK